MHRSRKGKKTRGAIAKAKAMKAEAAAEAAVVMREQALQQKRNLCEVLRLLVNETTKFARKHNIPFKTKLSSALGDEPEPRSECEEEFEGCVGTLFAGKPVQLDGVLSKSNYLEEISKFARELEVCWKAHLGDDKANLTKILRRIKFLENTFIAVAANE
tara:strand:+ start:256 stop:732 length:477 start_codon:yes stop_codon:yes gene_type:complete